MPSLLQDILSPGGSVARRLGAAYEHRPQQVEMATAIQDALADGAHLMVEAGTGVGKSFAYLLPAIDWSLRNNKRIIISTHTISLQEQLITKDIPLIQAVYPDEFAVTLVKGRSNYLCQRRLKQTLSKATQLLDWDRQVDSLGMIQQWALKTTDGSRSDMPQAPEGDVWDKVCAERGNCLGKRCTFYKSCFWQAARRRMQSGKILIVNHALFFSDLALRAAGVNYLPRYDAVIFDEAHTLEDVAQAHFGMNVSNRSMKYALRSIYDPQRESGFLASLPAKESTLSLIADLHRRCEDFFIRCHAWQKEFGRSNGRVSKPHWVENDLSSRLSDLSLALRAMLAGCESDDQRSELTSHADKIANLGLTLDALVSQGLSDAVYWTEIATGGKNISLNAAPISIAAALGEHLFAKVPAILTSATLCTDGAGKTADAPDKRFDYMISRMGIKNPRKLALGSPFDYEKQVTLYVEASLPDPGEEGFLPKAIDKILDYIDLTGGGAFVLFTSYAMLRSAAAALRPGMALRNLPLLVQGEGPPPRTLLERFRALDNAVLLGTSSFWQGVDVQGRQLRNVIIVKLPFSVPDEPIIEAKLEEIRARGGNPFVDFSIPEAIIRMKQGFGRLIRSRNDEGIVVVLDSRMANRRYGKRFLNSLPPCRRVIR